MLSRIRQPAELEMLPAELRERAPGTCEEIAYRAVTAAQIELKLTHDAPHANLLREMTLTLMAAATRIRLLLALRDCGR